MRDGKITLERAVNCYKPYRLQPKDEERYKRSQEFKERYGFHFEELWNLDAEFCYFMLIRLVRFRDNCISLPGTFIKGTKEDPWRATPADWDRWRTQLDKMIRGFYLYLTIDFPNEKEQKIIDKGMALFCKHYAALWD